MLPDALVYEERYRWTWTPVSALALSTACVLAGIALHQLPLTLRVGIIACRAYGAFLSVIVPANRKVALRLTPMGSCLAVVPCDTRRPSGPPTYRDISVLAPARAGRPSSCRNTVMKHVIGVIVSAAALGVAAWVVPGIVLSGHNDATKAGTLLVVALIFGIINTILKPIIKTVGCAFYVLTLGLVALVVNGLLLWLASYIAGKLTLPFHVGGFVAAVEGALIVGVVTWVVHLLLRDDH